MNLPHVMQFLPHSSEDTTRSYFLHSSHRQYRQEQDYTATEVEAKKFREGGM